MNKKATKSGVASFYVVIFATILFGVVTLSFMRIILSEAGQSSDDDLSRSAYDSAVAGVEDAKTAINRYYTCLSETGGSGDACNDLARQKIFKPDCDGGIGLATYLYGDSYNQNNTDGKLNPDEVLVQEANAGTSGSDNASDQAYTCVTISDRVPDYRGTLTPDTRTRMIPININTGSDSEIDKVNTISFSWYSRLNQGDGNNNYYTDTKLPPASNDAVDAPAVSLTLLRVGANMRMDEFRTANNDENYSTVVLLPSLSRGITSLNQSDLKTAGNVNIDPKKNSPFLVQCDKLREYACQVKLDGLSFNAGDNVFIVASLPYGNTTTDFMVTMSAQDGTHKDFTGVQISVDSTGRTNQLVRRVESRLDPIDLFFPYPQYEVELSSDDEDSLSKNFWITANCWFSQPQFNDGLAQVCNNNGEIATP